MSISATWQELPQNLLLPVMEGVLLQWEAAWLWDLFLLNPGQWFYPPPELSPALDRLKLWEMDAAPMVH